MNCAIVFQGQISSSELILITSVSFPRSPHDKLTAHYLLNAFLLGGPARKGVNGKILHTRVLRTLRVENSNPNLRLEAVVKLIFAFSHSNECKSCAVLGDIFFYSYMSAAGMTYFCKPKPGNPSLQCRTSSSIVPKSMVFFLWIFGKLPEIRFVIHTSSRYFHVLFYNIKYISNTAL